MAERTGLSQPDHLVYAIMIVLKQIGLITVPIFLFLSGAFFAFGVQNRPLKGAFRVVWQNILGVLWPYLIWTIVFNLIVSFLLKENIPPLQFVKNILVGYPYNFVPLLLVFYILAPLLIWGIKRFPAITLLVVFLYQLFLIVEVNPGLWGFALPSWAHYFALPVVRQSLSIWAIFFPLGIVYQLYSRPVIGFVRKYAVVILICLVLSAVLDDLHQLGVIVFPTTNYLFPLFFILLIPLIQRKVTPVFLWFEAIGKHSYGFYLMNLIVITLTLLGFELFFPWMLQQYLLLVPILFLLALYIPWGLFKLLEISPQRKISRYLFG